MNINNISENELRELIKQIAAEIFKEQNHTIDIKRKFNERKSPNNELESLIGTIPFILLDKSIFQRNMDVAEFAAKLGIIINGADKKKVDEIIGRIIVSIKEFPPSRIKQLNQAISSLKKSNKRSNRGNYDKKSFFEEWDTAIKNMKLS